MFPTLHGLDLSFASANSKDLSHLKCELLYNVGFLYFQAIILPALCFLKIVGKKATKKQVYISAADLVNFMFFQVQIF